ncbi:b8231684-30ab-4494-a2bb-b7a53b47e0f7 [Thermothielavioides terrestris]|uniref:DNA polymerase n=1 Tax=Thermothielavioides terrestris TaxID=2587410 RepID=A0A446BBB5_9PEZI|nr:b8231684-30ab-4494-a2bb-b7a53b47e0f7 [Thermothielavioides terrestris]
MDVFRVRLNCIDHYQAAPTRYDPPLRRDAHLTEAAKQPKVPVIRVFGSTETGQKVCAHIHGAFPYLYIEYGGPLDKATVSEYIYRLHLSIDHALAVSYRRDQYRDRQSFVARITLVKGVPFYGFYVGYRFYLKVYMLNPVVMTRLADLLQQGLIMGRKFQPYEAHLQYLLQFMTDYNLYGCDYLDAGKVRFRAPVPDPAGPDEAPRIWDSNTIPPESITDEYGLPRVSHCSIEVDICVQDILNRKAVKERRLHHDFVERTHPIPPDLKLVHSMAGLWRDETKRRKRRMLKSDAGDSPFPKEALVSMSADLRASQPPGWIHEEEYREQVRLLIEQESMQDSAELTFSNYIEPDPNGESVRTALQSVEDLFPENLLPALGLEQQLVSEPSNVASSIQVDEKGILELEVSEQEEQLSPDDSDEDMNSDEGLNQNGTAAGVRGQLVQKQTPAHPVVSGAEPPADTYSDEQPRKLVADLRRTINGLRGGFGVSGLRSGKRPSIPLPASLCSEAAFLALTSKPDVDTQPSESAELNDLKRPAPAPETDVPSKRLKCDPQSPASGSARAEPAPLNSDRPASESTAGEQKSTPTRPPQSLSQRKKAVSKGSSAKLVGNQTLSFPVVKDAHDPDTILRLTQRSASQRSDGGARDGTTRKQVSFDPLVSVQEVNLGSKATSAFRTTESPPPKWSPTPRRPGLHWTGRTTMFLFNSKPPSVQDVRSTLQAYGLPDVLYQDCFYSNDNDVPPRPREYAGREYRLDGNTVPYLPDFDPSGQSPAAFGVKPEQAPDLSELESAYEKQQTQCTLRSWEIAEPPPTFAEVSRWWTQKKKGKAHKTSSVRLPPGTQGPKTELSQIAGPTPKNTHGFKYSQKEKSTSVQHEAQYMSTMSLEIHVNTRGKLVPNPEEDEVQCIFWCLRSDEMCLYGSQSTDDTISGVIVLSEDGSRARQIRSQTSVEVVEETSELDLMTRMVDIVRAHDPDILTGYEVHGSSWGYLIERAMHKYDYDLCNEFSRMKSASFGRSGKEADRWGFQKTSMLHVTGRHVINVWRAMRGELNLLQYSMENVVWHLLHRRIPHYSWRTLTDWYLSGRPGDLSKVLRYYLRRTRLDIEILEANELIPRTSEQARLLGVDFFSVFSRGSQFKVESIMFRIAKPENFLLISPSRKQVGAQNALECLPLVMEPQSAFYTSPVLVLDFQSLYPSVMIAYNYCYSTCLGRIVSWRGTNKLGFTEYKRREGLLRLLKDYINVAPNGIMYTKPEIRKSLLAKMLTEILETRVMVKSGMKEDKDDKTLQKLLNNRQLALKLLANVTYGYTSASFSGRMPCSEIADSIVQTGRETLERAIAYIHSVERWNAEVVYGDTDSLFVYLKGRTREQAFEIGAEMAEEITKMNPRPVKLKFEKVYHPCVLLAKKRYVGYKYESREQTVPEFDAKGIETVRRDGTPADQKIEEKALKILFETADLSQVKEYFQSQCSKIMRGSVSVQDFCFAREVKLGTYSGKGPGPPGALISTKRMLEDARAEPQYGERVPYVVISGAPGARLIDRCVSPEDLLNNPHASLDAEYYISKNIIPRSSASSTSSAPTCAPALAANNSNNNNNTTNKKTLEFFMNSASCIACGVKMAKPAIAAAAAAAADAHDDPHLRPLCSRCASDPATTMAQLQARLNAEERKYADVVRVCQSCAGFAPLERDVPCDSRDCPVFYTRVKQRARVAADRAVVVPLLRALGAEGRGNGGLDW